MRVVVNGIEKTLPTSLSEMTLGQRIDFYEQHGRELDEMADSIANMPDSTEKELEIAHLQMEKMFRTFAFFTGTNAEQIKQSEFVDKVANIYYASLSTLLEDEEEIEPQQSFIWKGEHWELHEPELKHGSTMTFGEIIDAKQMVQNMADLGRGKWESLQKLCAVFLRKKGEPYHESFLYDGSDRLLLMRDLPMDIALQVGFFLLGSMSLFINTFRFSTQAGYQEEAAEMQKNTLIAGGG